MGERLPRSNVEFDTSGFTRRGGRGPALGFARIELAVIDSNLGVALMEQGTETARREACLAFARSLEGWRSIQADGPLTAESAAEVREVEGRMAACRGGSP